MILALDLGLSCGWAAHDGRDVTASGVWDLTQVGDEPGRRIALLRTQLGAAIDRLRPDLLAYEHVRHVGGGPVAAHWWGALWGVVMEECSARRLRYLGVAPAQVKRAAGLGSAAGKGAVVAAARARWPGWVPVSLVAADDECDARFAADAAASECAEAGRARATRPRVPTPA